MLGVSFTTVPHILFTGASMSQHSTRSQIELTAEDSDPLVVEVDPSAGEMHGVLANDQRREVLRALIDESDSLSLDTLVQRISARELDNSASPEARRQLRVSLYHTHLPKMDAHDLVAFDPTEQTVECVNKTVNSASD